MKKAIFLYDYTGIMAQPWLDAGDFECWIFDGQHVPGITREGNLVKVGMWFDAYKTAEHVEQIKNIVGDGVCFVFGFPECTNLTCAGAKHFESKRNENPMFQIEAINLAHMVKMVADKFSCAWGFENPVGVLSTLYRKPDFKFNPCDFGGYLPVNDVNPIYPEIYPGRDAYNKSTSIWCGSGFVEPMKKPVSPLHKENPGWKKCGGKSLKTKNIRSATPRGFALAVFEANHK